MLVALVPGAYWASALGAGRWVLADVLLSGLSAAVLLAAVVGLVVLAVRPGRLAAACAAFALTPLWGTPRAPAAGVCEGAALSVFFANTRSGNARVAELTESLGALGSDLVLLTEPPWALHRGVTRSGLLSERFPHHLFFRSDDPPAASLLVLSERPIRPLAPSWMDAGDGVVFSVSASGGGRPQELVVIAAHPASPRTLGRWRDGAAVTERVACEARGFASRGAAVVVAMDLNGPPRGYRDRVIGRDGVLVRAGIRGVGRGTFPSWAPGMRVEIDGVWLGPGLEQCEWSRSRVPGSDHLGVGVDVHSGRGVRSFVYGEFGASR